MSNTKVRSYCFTINNYTFEDIVSLFEFNNPRYLVFGFEIGENKTPHIQGYIYFDTPRYFNAIKKVIKRANIRAADGTPIQNHHYCTKEGEFYEFGEFPSQGKAKWDLIERAMQNPRENMQVFMQYRKAYNEIVNTEAKDHQRYLIMIPYDKRYEYAKKHETVSFDYSLETYNREDALIIPSFGDKFVMDWINGFPTTIKRGYEIIRVDPQFVYIMYENMQEYNHTKKKYLDYLDEIIKS